MFIFFMFLGAAGKEHLQCAEMFQDNKTKGFTITNVSFALQLQPLRVAGFSGWPREKLTKWVTTSVAAPSSSISEWSLLPTAGKKVYYILLFLVSFKWLRKLESFCSLSTFVSYSAPSQTSILGDSHIWVRLKMRQKETKTKNKMITKLLLQDPRLQHHAGTNQYTLTVNWYAVVQWQMQEP